VPDRAYLEPTSCVDADHPRVRTFARRMAGGLRDAASAVLACGSGFCVSKAVLLAAAARALGIPARLGFADVRNHLAAERMRRAMGTDLFVFHGYTAFHLDGRWVKTTPAFNRALCERFDVDPLEFDGRHDSLFQQADRRGNQYMEYVRDRGQFADLPLDEIRRAFAQHYPALAAAQGNGMSVPEEERP
jgi:transglutaminase-like putative cysteine protease